MIKILKNNRKSLYWAGLATGLIAAVQLTVLAGYGAHAYDIFVLPSYATTYLVPLIAQTLLVLGGVYLAWKKPFAGGIMLVAASLLSTSHIVVKYIPPDVSNFLHLSDIYVEVWDTYIFWVDNSTNAVCLSPWCWNYDTIFIICQMCLPSLFAGGLVLLSQYKWVHLITDENEVAIVNQRKDLHRSGVVVGLVYGSLGAIQFAVDDFWMAAVSCATLILLIGLLIAWKWPAIGGSFLVIMGLFLAIHHALYDYFLFVFPREWLIFALPLIGIGIIFLLSARKRYVLNLPPLSSA